MADYNLLNTEPGFIVADKPGVGGDRDTLLVAPDGDLPGQIVRAIRTFASR